MWSWTNWRARAKGHEKNKMKRHEKCEARKKREEAQFVRAEWVTAVLGRKTWQRGESCAEEWGPPLLRRDVGGPCDDERHGGEAESVPAEGEVR